MIFIMTYSIARRARKIAEPKLDFAGALSPPVGKEYPVKMGVTLNEKGTYDVMVCASGFTDKAEALSWMASFKGVLIHATGAVAAETKH